MAKYPEDFGLKHAYATGRLTTFVEMLLADMKAVAADNYKENSVSLTVYIKSKCEKMLEELKEEGLYK